MADHAKFLALAKKLITKHGRSTTFKTLSAGPSDSSKPWKGAGSTPSASTLATAMAVFLPHKGLDFGIEFVAPELIKDCSELLLVAGDAGALETCNSITDGNKDYRVNWVAMLKPADLTLLYAMGVVR